MATEDSSPVWLGVVLTPADVDTFERLMGEIRVREAERYPPYADTCYRAKGSANR